MLKELKRKFKVWLYDNVLKEDKQRHETEVVHAVLKDSQAWFVRELLKVEEAHKQEVRELKIRLNEMQDELAEDCEEVEDLIKRWDDANERLNVAHGKVDGLQLVSKHKDVAIQKKQDEIDVLKRKLELEVSLKEEAYTDYTIMDEERKEKEEECLAMQRALKEAGVTLGIKVKKNTGKSKRAQAYKKKGELQKERTVQGLHRIATACNMELTDEKKQDIRRSLGYIDTSKLDKAIQEGSKILKKEVKKKEKEKQVAEEALFEIDRQELMNEKGVYHLHSKQVHEHPCMYKECADCPEIDTCIHKKDAEDIEDVPLYDDDKEGI